MQLRKFCSISFSLASCFTYLPIASLRHYGKNIEKLMAEADASKFDASKEAESKVPEDVFEKISFPIIKSNEQLNVSDCLELSRGEEINRELLTAVKDGDEQKVASCLNDGGDIDFKDEDGVPLLQWACHKGYARIVNILSVKGADWLGTVSIKMSLCMYIS
jgi:ankyrin repeat protein